MSNTDIKPQSKVVISGDGRAMLNHFGSAKVLGVLGFGTNFLKGCVACMAPELFSADLNIHVETVFSKESDVYAYGMLCQEVRVQLISSIEQNSRDSRYLLEQTLSLGTQNTITESWPLS